MQRSLFLVVTLLCLRISAHSWIVCTDYTEENGRYYTEDKCRGYPRNWDQYNGGTFGQDTGYDHQNYGCSPTQDFVSPMSSMYSQRFPMARYSPGQRVCLAWPSKNHVAATCTNEYIEDGGISLFYHNRVNPTANPSQEEFNQNEITPFGNGKHQNGEIDFLGFQNCPAFCENMDKSLCTGCFTVPPTLQTGNYTFQWSWVFNPGPPYTTCFDVEIVGGSAPSTGGGDGGAPSLTGGSSPSPSTPSESDPSKVSGSYSNVVNMLFILVLIALSILN